VKSSQNDLGTQMGWLNLIKMVCVVGVVLKMIEIWSLDAQLLWVCLTLSKKWDANKAEVLVISLYC